MKVVDLICVHGAASPSQRPDVSSGCLSCGCRAPGVGDVVIFHPREGAVAKPEWYEDDVFIKRIVATAGDTVEVRPAAV